MQDCYITVSPWSTDRKGEPGSYSLHTTGMEAGFVDGIDKHYIIKLAVRSTEGRFGRGGAERNRV